MTKKNIWKYVANIIRQCDIVVEVIDARCPKESRSEKLEAIVKDKGKEMLIILNKADLVSRQFAKTTRDEILKTHNCIYVSIKKKAGVFLTKTMLKSIAKNKKIRVAVIGRTNTGKSSLINVLRGKRSARVAPIPGYTKHGQWIKISDNIMMWDTPGVIPRESRSVLRGNVDPEKLEELQRVAEDFLERVFKSGTGNIREIYGIYEKTPYGFLSELTKKRCFIVRKGAPDIDRACRVIIRDWNKGKIKAEIC